MRSLADWIVASCADQLPRRRIRFLDVAREIPADTNLTEIRHTFMNLNFLGEILIIHQNNEPAYLSLTRAGIARAKEIFWRELKFRPEWLTYDVKREFTKKDRDILHDALYEAGASDAVLSACKHPIKSGWLIREIYRMS